MRRGFWIRAAVAVAAAMVASLAAVYIHLLANGTLTIYAADFMTYYSSARVILAGHGSEIYNFALIDHNGAQVAYPLRLGAGPYLYTPWFAVLTAPLALLPYDAAYVLWVVVNAIAALIALLSLSRYAGLSRLQTALFTLLGLSCLPVFAALGQGQVSVLILALLAGALQALRRDNDAVGGFLLALVMVKPQYALPLVGVLLLRRRWRACIAFGICATALIIIPIPLLGAGIEGGYVHALMRFNAMHGTAAVFAPPRINYSLQGFLALAIPSYAGMARIFFVVAAVPATIWAAVRSRTIQIPLALAVAVTLLASPHVLIYDVSLLILPLAVLLRGRAAWAVLAAAVYVAPVAGLVLHDGVPLTVPVMTLTAVALAWCACAAQLQAAPGRSPTPPACLATTRTRGE